MEIKIREERSEDYERVFKLIQNAFEKEKYSDHNEQFLVEKLRSSEAFIPELSLVAEKNDVLVGYILLTKIKIKNDKEERESLALGPVAVLRQHQGRGIGSQLIVWAHKQAEALGYSSIVVLGHENYYPKFGYQIADQHGITIPFDVPRENCMVIELTKGALKGVKGTVEYAKPFYEDHDLHGDD